MLGFDITTHTIGDRMLAAGARLTMSANYPIAPVNPFLQISIAMARKDPGQKEFLGAEIPRCRVSAAPVVVGLRHGRRSRLDAVSRPLAHMLL